MPGPTPRPVIDRVLDRIAYEPNTGCWLWEGNVNHKGYGQVSVGHSGMTATHRVAYNHFKGPIHDGMQVLHSCDVPCCCNPQHLWLGTHQDNVNDKMRKGRHRIVRTYKTRGSANGNSKLTDDVVRHIKRRDRLGKDYAELYGVSRAAISAIHAGHTWRHISV